MSLLPPYPTSFDVAFKKAVDKWTDLSTTNTKELLSNLIGNTKRNQIYNWTEWGEEYGRLRTPPPFTKVLLICEAIGDWTPVEIALAYFKKNVSDFPAASANTLSDMMQLGGALCKEMGDVLTRITEYAPGGYDKTEKADLRKQIMDVMRVCSTAIKALEEEDK